MTVLSISQAHFGVRMLYMTGESTLFLNTKSINLILKQTVV